LPSLTPVNESTETLAALSEGAETFAALSEGSEVLAALDELVPTEYALYPGASTYPGSTAYLGDYSVGLFVATLTEGAETLLPLTEL
jgi:hypothetical protein